MIGAAVRDALVLAVFAGKALAQLAVAVAVHLRLIPVDAKVLGDIILVGVETDDNDSLAEGGGYESQQQKKGRTFLQHVPEKVWAKVG